MTHSIIIPDLGATGGDVKIVEWLVREGQHVNAGDTLFVVETDKATEEIPAFRAGYLRRVLAHADEERLPGDVVGLMTDTSDEAIVDPTAASVEPVAAVAATTSVSRVVRRLTASPRARHLARQHNLDLANVKAASASAIQVRDVVAALEGQPVAADWLIAAFRRMVLIRRYEEHLYQLFLQGLVPGTLHQCQGQEAVAVGVCSSLRRDDMIFSTHRPVGHLLAKGASLNAITAEIWGKATGCVGGKGGQMHLADFSVGAMVSNAIVGANIPIATGCAMAFKLQGLDRVAVSFFGDGACNIGAFHEGLNLAAVQDAPVVFVCENNLYAASTHISVTTRISNLADRAAAYGMRGYTADGMDVEAVSALAAAAIERARLGKGPTLLEYRTYRYRGHSRGDPCGYRADEEQRSWLARDPIERARTRLNQNFGVTEENLGTIEQECQREIEAAVEFALASPEPTAESCLEHVFA